MAYRTGVLAQKAWKPRAARALLAGFTATSAMTATLLIAYTLMANFALVLPFTVLRDWFWALTHNTLVELTTSALPLGLAMHLTIGIGLALVYAFVAEPRLPGADWQRGVLFALVPWLLSVVLFLPLAGGGVLGFAFGAGPLPIFGNLVLHLVYGVVLGTMYGPTGDVEDRQADRRRNADASTQEGRIVRGYEMGAALGLVLGALLGTCLGGVIGIGIAQLAPPSASFSPWTYALTGGALGTAGGALIGSFAGMSPAPTPSPTAVAPANETAARHRAAVPAKRRQRAPKSRRAA